MIAKPEDICLEIESSLTQSGLYSNAPRGEGDVPNMLGPSVCGA